MVNISTSSAKFFRRLLCFFLALLFAFCCVIHPLRAKASITAATGAVVGLTAATAIGAAMIGLGLMPDGDGSAFTSLVDSVASTLDTAWTTASSAGEVLLKAVLYKDNIFLQKELLQDILDSVFNSDAVSHSGFVEPSGADTSVSAFISAYNYYMSLDSVPFNSAYFGSKLVYFLSDTSGVTGEYCVTVYPLKQLSDGDYIQSPNYGFQALILGMKDGVPYYEYEGPYIRSDWHPVVYQVAFDSLFSVSAGFIMGNLAPDINSPTYTDWAEKTQIIEFPTTYDPNDPEIPEESEENNLKRWLGLGLTASTLAGLLTASQANVQAGLNEAVDPDSLYQTGEQVAIQTNSATDPDPDPDPDPGTTTNPDAAPEVTPGNFQVDLTQFFPFCIPFDLYKMLSCLAADPVAPKFTFAIPTGLYGQIYEFEIDLAAWDEVAATLRIFETAIFCVGLYFATSKLIKW